MKRCLGFVLFLGLGLIVTVVIAWTHAVTVDPLQDVRQGEEATTDDYWQITRWGRLGAAVVRSTHNPMYRGRPFAGGVPLDEIKPAWLPGMRPDDDYVLDRRTIDARGWPMLALCSFRDVRTARDGVPMSVVDLEGGVSTRFPAWTYGGPAHVRAIPLHPMWTGLAVDSVAYGAILWLAFIGPFGLRRTICRRRRRRRGRCMRCGYPVGDSARCPECGTDRDGQPR